MSSHDKISRREFLERTSLAVGAVAAVPALAGVGPMEAAVTIPRRPLGRTGVSVSILAMGCGSRFLAYPADQATAVLEKAVGVMVLLFGLLLLADVNLWKRLTWFQRLGPSGDGRWSGLLLGLSLGLVWIPCVGPMLSAVLAMVAAKGTLAAGVGLLLVYSLGFAVPMLAVGYGSQALRQRVRALASRPGLVRWASGLLLVAFGLVILTQGMLFAGM